MGSDTPQWIKVGDEWTVTVNGTVYTAVFSPGQWGKEEYYVQRDGQSFMRSSGSDWPSLALALDAIVKHEADKG
ncbi:hypothetical protein F4556_005199 [Kitasatospora gansuensis]|uniref:Uncharacterized protein n=1 Tax=Kitasatospora gansuensis TaxID=258050 RepID=A0A7W7WKF2_9ACTN|nr:hypothetical protein [Kitasatospora gansuensis]MBB4949664.1 hypothetical protein [Kitasatospora gansuensis]